MARRANASRQAVPSPEQLERERKVLELRQAGAGFDQIAATVGFTNRGTAYRAYHRALARVHYPEANAARELEAARLDRLQAARWAKALAGDDKAFDQVMRVIDTRIRLLGLSHADGIAAREARVNELQAALMAQTIRAVVEELPLTPVQRDEALRTIAARVAGITAGDVADVPEPEPVVEGTIIDEEGAP